VIWVWIFVGIANVSAVILIHVVEVRLEPCPSVSDAKLDYLRAIRKRAFQTAVQLRRTIRGRRITLQIFVRDTRGSQWTVGLQVLRLFNVFILLYISNVLRILQVARASKVFICVTVFPVIYVGVNCHVSSVIPKEVAFRFDPELKLLLRFAFMGVHDSWPKYWRWRYVVLCILPDVVV
jgi:hypothetical protein